MAIQVVNSPITFLDAYVTAFSAAFGFNTSPSTLNLTLVSVPTDGAIFVTDDHPIGAFRTIDLGPFSDTANFKFGGLITSKVENKLDITGNTWDIQLTDPRVAMKAITLILSPNPGTLQAATEGRVIDVYNALNSPDNEFINVSSFSGGGGGINIRDVLVVAGLSDTIIPTIAGITIPPPASSQVADIWGDRYFFRFVNAPTDANFKVNGDTITMLDLVQQTADGNAFDWYVDSFDNGNGIQVDVKVIDRKVDNQEISLQEFIDLVNGGPTQELVEKATAGLELRQDATGAIVYSDRVEFIETIERTASVPSNSYELPIADTTFGGVDPNRMFSAPVDSIQPHRIRLPIDANTFEPLEDIDVASKGYIPEDDEMRAAIVGFDNWLLYLGFVREHPISSNASFFTNNIDFENGFSDEDITTDFWEGALDQAKKKTSRTVGLTDLQRMAYDSAEYEFIRTIRNGYDVVRGYAQEAYGRVYKFPQRKDADVVGSASTRTIEILSFDAPTEAEQRNIKKGFEYGLFGEERPTYGIETINDSAGESLIVDNFFDDGNGNGRTVAYAFYQGVTKSSVEDASFIVTESPDNFIFTDTGLFVKVTVSNGIFKVSPLFDLSNTPCVANDIIAAAMLSEEGLSLDECIDPNNPLKDATTAFCDDLLNDAAGRYKMAAIAKVPDKVYIPYKHKKDIYQIYSSFAVGGQSYGTGPITVERDESLNPANFNNFGSMNAAGFAKVLGNSSTIKDIETGTVIGADLPIKNLGDPAGLNSNITGVSISFGIDGVKTTYTLESFIKRYGKREKIDTDAFARATRQINKNVVSTNAAILQRNTDRVKIIDDVRTEVLSKYSIFTDSPNPFGCAKILEFDLPDDNKANVQKKKAGAKTAIIGMNKGPLNSSKLKSNIPEIRLEESTDAIPPNNWKEAYGGDIGLLITGFKMGDSLSDGGDETFESTGEPGPGDLNIYKPVNIGGDSTMPFKQIVYGDTPVEGGGFDINKIRGIAFRLPMMLSGWGYTVDGEPTFENEEDKLNMETWRTAPLDVRYDPVRNLWVATGGSGVSQWKRWDV